MVDWYKEHMTVNNERIPNSLLYYYFFFRFCLSSTVFFFLLSCLVWALNMTLFSVCLLFKGFDFTATNPFPY